MNFIKFTTTFFLLFLVSIVYSQIPEHTVVFKVRKNTDKPIIVPRIEREEEGVWFVEENATFMGGDLNTFNNWVKNQVQYPVQASDAGISGKVILQFSVDTKGKVCDIKVMRSVHSTLDNESIRAIQSSPLWTPAKQNGKVVKQNFVIPVVFTIQ